MKTKRFDVYTDTGDYYSFVEIPLAALQNGWEQPRYVVVDGVICEGDGKGKFIRKESDESLRRH